MLTVHCLWNKIGDEVQRACSALHINKNHMRVVRMGKGVIVLEDTNRAEPCGEKEVLKALGIVKTADKRSVSISIGSAEAEKQKDPEEELYWIQPYGEENQEPIVITVYKK